MCKIIISFLCFIILSGCGTSTNFIYDNKVISKNTGKNGLLYRSEFMSPDTFANVGDTIAFIDNKIVVCKRKEEQK